jgi:hypothetical protein
MKSYPRLPVGAKHREEARIENWLSMPITLAFIPPAEECDILRLAGWFELPILHTHQIYHHQTFFYSVISKACSMDDISRPGTSFYPLVTIEKVTLQREFLAGWISPQNVSVRMANMSEEMNKRSRIGNV